MPADRTSPTPSEVTMEVASLSAGLGVLTIPLFPFMLPALLLVVVPLAVVAAVPLLLASPVILVVWLVRRLGKGQTHRRGDLDRRRGERPAVGSLTRA